MRLVGTSPQPGNGHLAGAQAHLKTRPAIARCNLQQVSARRFKYYLQAFAGD
jgi:hypothetical protein